MICQLGPNVKKKKTLKKEVNQLYGWYVMQKFGFNSERCFVHLKLRHQHSVVAKCVLRLYTEKGALSLAPGYTVSMFSVTYRT